MKRFLVTLVAGLMIFAASGCGGETKPAPTDKPADAAAPAAGEKAPDAPAK